MLKKTKTGYYVSEKFAHQKDLIHTFSTRQFGDLRSTPDCLPILFYDPIAKIIGVAHAGWQGILKLIVQQMIELMVKMGAIPENILVAVGPHIGGCCYNIDSSSLCTSCQNNEFFSYRKNREKNFGEMLSVISLTK